MRHVLRPLLTLVLSFWALPLLDGHVMAQAYGSAQASASVQSGVVPSAQADFGYVPQQQFRVIERQVVPSDTVIEREITIPAEYEDVVVRRQVAPERTVIQREVVQRDVVQYAPVRELAYAPVRSFAVGNSCNVGARSLANVGYGVGVGANIGYGAVNNNVIVNRGLVANRGLGRQRAQRTVSRSKAVTRTGRPGVLNGLLGR